MGWELGEPKGPEGLGAHDENLRAQVRELPLHQTGPWALQGFLAPNKTPPHGTTMGA